MDISIQQIAMRMLLALVAGTVVGFERTKAGKPAGIRTHSLVCIAFTMITIVSAYGFKFGSSISDPARLVAQALTGIGFLGAGIIWKQNDGEIRGLTTATNVWAVAGLGIAIGLGYNYLALITLVFMLIALKMSVILRFLGILKYKGN